MLPLSQTTGYALRALRCLEEPGGAPILVETIADFTGIPRSYLSKLIHRLAKQGLVMARRGHHGGVVLARPSNGITLAELSEAIDGTSWHARCLLGLHSCTPETPCVLHEYWGQMREDILEHLGKVTLADLAGHADPGVERCRAHHQAQLAQAMG